MAVPTVVPPPGGDRERMGEHLRQVTYTPPLPEGTRRDGRGLPVVEPHPDEDPDEDL